MKNFDIDIDFENQVSENFDIDIERKFDIVPCLIVICMIFTGFLLQIAGIVCISKLSSTNRFEPLGLPDQNSRHKKGITPLLPPEQISNFQDALGGE